MTNQLKNLPLSLVCKLGSIATHAEELLSDDGHSFDRAAIMGLLGDHEVRHLLAQMKEMALLPVMRKQKRGNHHE